MPSLDSVLTSQLKGCTIDSTRLRKGSDWYEQASDRFHYGFARDKGLWVTEIEPLVCCGHFPVRLFVFLRVDSKRRIQQVETAVCQSYNDGSYDELDAEFYPPDQDTARDAIVDALTEKSRAALVQATEVRW